MAPSALLVCVDVTLPPAELELEPVTVFVALLLLTVELEPLVVLPVVGLPFVAALVAALVAAPPALVVSDEADEVGPSLSVALDAPDSESEQLAKASNARVPIAESDPIQRDIDRA